MTSRQRVVHPGAWWTWALAIGVAATATTNILVLGLLVAVICFVVAACRDLSAGGTPFALYLWVAAGVVLVRLVFRVVLPAGQTAGEGTVLLSLPTLHLGPLDLFGPVTAQAVASGLVGGLQLAAIILAVGAAHTLADVLALLKHAPAGLAGLSASVVVAVSTFPELGRSVVQVRRAAMLRGGAAGLRRTVVPVLEGTMDRSLDLAAALEARGYGSAPVRTGRGRGSTALRTLSMVGALGLVAVAAYALFDEAWPWWTAPAAAAASGGMLWGVVRAAGTARRTVYRPDRWTWASTAVACSGIGCAVGIALLPATVRHPGPSFLPALTTLALLIPLVAAAPALATDRRSS